MRRENKRNIEGLGVVDFKGCNLCYSDIGLYIPIEEANATVKAEYEKSERWFTESFATTHPELSLADYTLNHDISLHININNDECEFSVAIIMWVDDENGEEIHAEFYDPFSVDISEEDAGYIKGKIIQKLSDIFFK